METLGIVVLDLGIDFDHIAGPLACCSGSTGIMR